MRRIGTTLLGVLMCAAAGTASGDEERIATLAPYFGAAFSGKKRVFPFRPTDGDVERIEKALRPYLKAKHPALAKKAFSYYRQYGGMEVVGGDRKILGNFMCRVDGDTWKHEWIHTLDGGDCFFTVLFDAAKDVILEVHVNGQA